ncbi:hypothetical protein ABFV99_07540 [Cytobacillus horneckiae]|uniref:hypothetical protein n=1 Tax=Cytobacillus horneckiae TaxID=549687 RepID=UPI00203CF6E8|nr:hypothetical protein [Cytobacillus horneckiae]MCM3179062.1 hypothetical protein [Cytobacillus horneckiae]
MISNQLTLMEAYMIETLRNNGLSNQEILTKAKAGETESWSKINEHFDFQQLAVLANEDEQRFQSILQKGYQIKFLTYPGLQRILSMKFKLEKERDYTLTDNGLSGLKLNNAQLHEVEKILSPNWKVQKDSDGTKIEIV